VDAAPASSQQRGAGTSVGRYAFAGTEAVGPKLTELSVALAAGVGNAVTPHLVRSAVTRDTNWELVMEAVFQRENSAMDTDEDGNRYSVVFAGIVFVLAALVPTTHPSTYVVRVPVVALFTTVTNRH
jgi:hypothetical protein